MKQEESLKHEPKDWLKIIQYIFWIAFIILPIVLFFFNSPMLGYGYNYEPIASYKEKLCTSNITQLQNGEADSCSVFATVDKWRDTKTGEIYTRDNFKEYRDSEDLRVNFIVFCYLLIGCFFIGGIEYFKRKEFFKYFGIAVLVNILFTIFMIISSYYQKW